VYEADAADLDGDADIDFFFLSLAGFQDGWVRNDLVPSGACRLRRARPSAPTTTTKSVSSTTTTTVTWM